MRILVATGGSAHSDTAVRLGAHIAAITNSPLPTLLTVIRRESERIQGQTILALAQALLTMSVPSASAATSPPTLLRVGSPAEEIIAEAKAGAYDLLLIGERPEHGLIKRLVGPTAGRIIAHLPCPVLIARRDSIPLRRFLLCEGWRDPLLLNRLGTQLAPLLRTAAELTLLHVMSQMVAAPGISGWELRADANELIEKQTVEGTLLEQDMAALQELTPRIQPKVRHGLVVDEILAEANSGNYDLIVIGAHKGGMGWERLLLDDVAHQIMSQANHSVLVV